MGAASASAASFPGIPVTKCGADAVLAGPVCLDRFEASVWRVSNPTTTNPSLVRRIQLGRATAADLTAGGATQLGTAVDDYAPSTDNGQNCANDIYAVSLPSVLPPAFITWFQAQAAWRQFREAAADQRRVAGGGERDAGPRAGQRDDRLQQRGPVAHRRAQQLRLGARGVRHGGQRVRVGGGLGAALDGVPGLGQLQQ